MCCHVLCVQAAGEGTSILRAALEDPVGAVLERLPSATQPGHFTTRHITNSDGIKAFDQIPQSNNSFQWWDPGA